MDCPFPDSIPLTPEMIAEAEPVALTSSAWIFTGLSDRVEIPLD